MWTLTAKRCRSTAVVTRLLSTPTIPHLSFLHSAARSIDTLAFEEVQASLAVPYTSTAVFLHGLLGSARNWRSFSRSLASELSSSSEWRMVLVDQRNHGKSAEVEALGPPHDMFNAANDVASLIKSRRWAWPEVVIGHSMGGKVALQFLESAARGDYGESVSLPKQVWVLDSVPGEVRPEFSDGEVEKVLKTLQGLPSSIPSRRWLVNHMMELGFSKSLSDWVGSNLNKAGDHETWAFSLEGAIQMFDSYRETSYWSLLEHPPRGTEIGIVVAEKSDRWDPETIHRLESIASRSGDESEGKVSLHRLPKSGHWVHVDNPTGLLEIVAGGMRSLST